ncbi:flavodoxin [Psychrobacillus vulpis]|nr:flavodoxin [Psychrobacillus vulpis]
MKAIICYLSYSGNTEEIAELIKRRLVESGYLVDMYMIGFGPVPDLSIYDKIFLGTFTWDKGSTPDEMKEFALEVGYKPDNVYVFGSGDTQFGGDDLFCGAVDKLVKFYNCCYGGLKIEQSPRGSQEKIVTKWLEGVLENG